MTPTNRLVRRLTLALLVAWFALLGGILVQRQLGSGAPTATPPPDQATGGERPTRVHRGFVHTVTLGSEPNFRVAASQAVEYDSGWYELQDVEIALYQGGEVAYGLAAERARFNQAKQEADVQGGARLSLRGGVVVHASGFTVRGPDRTVSSQGTVTFAGPGWGGAAGGLESSLAHDTMTLLGNVSVSWRGEGAESGEGAEVREEVPIVLLAPRLEYRRREARALLPEGATMLRAGMRARSSSCQLTFSGEEDLTLRRATLASPVTVDGSAEGDVEAEAGDTVLEARGDGRFALTAERSATGWVHVRWRPTGAGWREMTARRLIGEGTAAAWEWLEGQADVCATEEQGSETRTLEAERLRIGFESGRAATATAFKNVELRAGERRSSGSELTYSIATGRFALVGAQGRRVVSEGPEGEARADRVEGDGSGALRAFGHVSGVARRAALWGAGEAPVHFAAMEATVAEGRERITLEGEARVWQAERLVRADTLVYQPSAERVSGQGKVLTTATIASETGAPAPFDVRSRAFTYDRPSGLAIYEGEVVTEDGRAITACQRLTVTLGADGRVSLAVLEGGVDVKEKATGRWLRGERGRLDQAKNLLELWGSPVIVQEKGGNEVRANHVQWRRGSDTLVLGGRENEPTETIYYPEPTPKPGAPRPTPTPPATPTSGPGGPA